MPCIPSFLSHLLFHPQSSSFIQMFPHKQIHRHTRIHCTPYVHQCVKLFASSQWVCAYTCTRLRPVDHCGPLLLPIMIHGANSTLGELPHLFSTHPECTHIACVYKRQQRISRVNKSPPAPYVSPYSTQ